MRLSHRCARAAALLALATTAFGPAAAANHSVVERLPDGPSHSALAGVSQDGRHIYLATVNSLLPEDTNPAYDVYDLHDGTLTLVTVQQDPFPREAGDGAYFGGASTDGSRVWFGSNDPFVASDVNGRFDAYERFAGTTRLLTTGPGRPDGNNVGLYTALAYSADGTRFIFGTPDPLVPEDTDPVSTDIYERSGESTRLLSGWGGAEERSSSIGFRSASNDARTVVFQTAQALVPEDTNGIEDLYAAIDGALHVIAPPSWGYFGSFGYFVQASGDGPGVFFSSSHRLTPDDTDANIDAYVWSPGRGPELMSIGAAGGNGDHHVATSAVSPDGTRAFFRTTEQLTADDTDAVSDVYEFSAGSTKLVSSGPSASGFSGISGDSEHLFFITDDRLTADDTDDGTDLYETVSGQVRLISTGPTDPHDTDTAWYEASSQDGSRVFFATRGRMTAEDHNDKIDLYERFGHTTTLITSGTPERRNVPFESLHLTVSPDGTRVYYDTVEQVLPSDTDTLLDVYVVSTATPYVHPRGATPLRTSLVPTFKPCDEPDSTHGPPLAFPSCNPPVANSSSVVLGAKGVAFARLAVRPGDPSSAEDEADVGISVAVTDVRASAGEDYGGELVLVVAVRLTDRSNGESAGDSATVQDTDLRFPFTCTSSGEARIGSACNLTTSADAVLPGFAMEGQRSIMSLQSIAVEEPEGVRFLRQGVFVP